MARMFMRRYQPEDCAALAKLFYDTVHSVNAKDYTPPQLAAWAPEKRDMKKWADSFEHSFCVIAVQAGEIIGFGDIKPDGYLDRLYVHKNHQREGVASALCDTLEQSVRAECITTHASITAKPFFEKRGYRIIREQQVERQGILLTNFVMEKRR